MGFVEDYLQLASKRAPSSPIEYSEATALWVLASILEKKVWTPMNWGNVFPNIYGLLMGRSTISHKSTAIRPGRELLVRVAPNELLPSDFSPEGLFTEMAERKPAVGYMAVDDVGGLLWKMKKRDYMGDAKDLLMRLWDCETPIHKRLKKDNFYIRDACMSLIATITPERFMDVMDESDLKDGFLARFLVVFPKPIPTLPARMRDGYMTQMENDLAQDLKDLQAAFHGGKTLQLQLRGPALARYTDWTGDVHEQIKTGEIEASMAAIASRADTYAIKLTQLFQISDLMDDLNSLHGVSALAMDNGAMKRALKWLDGYLDGARRFVDLILMPAGAQAIKNLIWDNPGIDWQSLLILSRKTTRGLRAILDFWEQRGEVEQRDKSYYPAQLKKVCLSCKQLFPYRRVDAIYCSAACRKRAQRKRDESVTET